MAELKPFCAWRYSPNKVNIERVIAPPYDVISKSYQAELYKRSEFNVVRLILGKDSIKDNERDNKYTRARRYLNEWSRMGMLKKDAKPSFYLYRQSYMHPERHKRVDRTAFFALLKLEPFGKGVVFPHEQTHSLPKVDRLNLIKQVEANLSPVFGLYDDEKGETRAVLESYFDHPPLYKLTDDHGVRHVLSKIDDPHKINKITAAFHGKPIFIADGHHRYETALNYKKHLDTQHLSAQRRAASDHVLVAFVDFSDPGLLIFPTHRMLKHAPHFNKARFLKALGDYFEVVEVKPAKIMDSLDHEDKEGRVIGLYFGKKEGYILRLRDEEKLLSAAPKRKTKEWALLDVSFISYLILGRLLGIGEDKIEETLAYTRSAREAFSTVDQGKALMSFMLRPISVDDMRTVCEQGELLPQKSTYFYPKLLSGLVFHRHTDGC
ncbi:MAG: DUF1015 domain-containing protein [Candidatus Omnitrophica bacterium]|nr:DUF1015 domain-containing protein [Candidatus Omnitrophota bacterium]